jgi:hypothetical protein
MFRGYYPPGRIMIMLPVTPPATDGGITRLTLSNVTAIPGNEVAVGVTGISVGLAVANAVGISVTVGVTGISVGTEAVKVDATMV